MWCAAYRLYYWATRINVRVVPSRGPLRGKARLRKPQVTGSNPVVGSILRSRQRGERKCHAAASAQPNRLIPSNFLSRATARQALHCELLESDDERWRLPRRQLSEGGLSVKRLAFQDYRLVLKFRLDHY